MSPNPSLTNRHLDAVGFHAIARPEAAACRDLHSGSSYSYRELHERIDRCAAWLTAATAGAEVRVSALSRNHLDMIVLFLACGRAGRIFHPLNFRLVEDELAVILSDAGSGLLVHDEEGRAVAQRLRSRVRGLELQSIESLDLVFSTAQLLPFESVNAQAPLALLYTSGTSGAPKGAVLTHANVHFSAGNMLLIAEIGSASVVLCDVPLFHLLALIALVRTTFLAGGVLLVSRGFEPDLTLTRLMDETLGVTHYFCVPQVAHTLRQKLEQGQLPNRFPKMISGGAPISPTAVSEWVEAGIFIANGYGMTEAGSIFQMPLNDLSILDRKKGSVGVPMVAVETRLVGDGDEEVPTGDVGELWLRGPTICDGYWNKPKETARAFTPDGWFKTGDLARVDADGFWWIVDRKKDMFISGGENVYSVEVEAVIAELDDVAHVAVIGVPDEDWGEVGCAFVVPEPGMRPEAAGVIARCRGRLARYKIPKHVAFVPDLPRTASGKIQKQKLRDHWLESGRAAEH